MGATSIEHFLKLTLAEFRINQHGRVTNTISAEQGYFNWQSLIVHTSYTTESQEVRRHLRFKMYRFVMN